MRVTSVSIAVSCVTPCHDKTNDSRDVDDAPEVTDAMLDRPEIVKDGKVIQRGVPRS